MDKKILNVLYQSNDNYAAITGVSITSLLKNNIDLDEIHIYLLNDNISEKNIEKFKKTCSNYERELTIVNTKEILAKLKKLKVSPFKNTYTTYFKLMAIKNLKIKGDRILQLDGDTIINDSLKELCVINLDNCILRATYDCTMNKYKKFIDIPLTDKYYNCGVLLINQKMWIKNNCEDKIINHLKNVRNGYYTVDQDIINVLFRDKIEYLDIKYNFNSGFYIYGIKESLKMYGLKENYYDTYQKIKETYDNPIIYHCMGAMTGRPWEQDSIHPQNKLFDKYLYISEWKDYKKIVVNRNKIFKIQKHLYLHLPRNIYILLHKLGQYNYLRNMNKKVQDKKRKN